MASQLDYSVVAQAIAAVLQAQRLRVRASIPDIAAACAKAAVDALDEERKRQQQERDR